MLFLHRLIPDEQPESSFSQAGLRVQYFMPFLSAWISSKPLRKQRLLQKEKASQSGLSLGSVPILSQEHVPPTSSFDQIKSGPRPSGARFGPV